MTLKDTPDIVTAVRRRRARVQRRGRDGERARAGAASSRASRRSSCCIHQGGVPGQETWYGPDGKPYTVNPTYDCDVRKGAQLTALARSSRSRRARPGHRPGRLGSHAPALRLQHPDPPATPRMVTVGLVVRPAVHRHRPDLRQAHPGHRADVGQEQNVLVTRDVAKDATQTALIRSTRRSSPRSRAR